MTLVWETTNVAFDDCRISTRNAHAHSGQFFRPICLVKRETFIEAKLATRGLFGRVQALLQDQCLPRKRVCLLAGFTNTFDGTLACKLTTRDENFVAPLMPDIRASMRKMIEHFSGMPADYMHYTPVKINRQVIEIFTFYEAHG